jgi:hypothetical protein
MNINDYETKLKDGRFVSINGKAKVTYGCDCDGRPSHTCIDEVLVIDATLIEKKGGLEIRQMTEVELDKVRKELEDDLTDEVHSREGED